MPVPERQIFISYSSTDRAVADQVCAGLESAGYLCWIAPRNIEPGSDYPTAILDGVRNAQTVVVIISAAAVASPHILSEIEHAFGEKKPIIPFRLSNATLPENFDYFLAMSQWLDAHQGCTSENLALLKEAITQALAHRIVPTPAKTSRRYQWFASAGAVFLVLLGAIVYSVWPSPRIVKKDLHTTDPQSMELKDNAHTGATPQPWVNPKDGLTYVWIPPGTFTLGCSPGDTECKADESPSHLVELPAGFWLGQTEVTNDAYKRVVASWTFPANEGNLPAVNISWREAKAYCAAAGGRLPVEAEWEYAARGGVSGPYYGVPSKIAWFAGNSGDARHAVATKEPNAYGLYDMLGNASEWVLDRYYNKYDLEAPPLGDVDQPLASNASALTRGGYWESEVRNIRVSRRTEMDSTDAAPMAGIRCIADRTK